MSAYDLSEQSQIRIAARNLANTTSRPYAALSKNISDAISTFRLRSCGVRHFGLQGGIQPKGKLECSVSSWPLQRLPPRSPLFLHWHRTNRRLKRRRRRQHRTRKLSRLKKPLSISGTIITITTIITTTTIITIRIRFLILNEGVCWTRNNAPTGSWGVAFRTARCGEVKLGWRSRLALRCIRRIATFRSLTVQSGHWPELALDASVVNDPKRTSS